MAICGLPGCDQAQGFFHIGLIVVAPGAGADRVAVIHQHVPESVGHRLPIQSVAHGAAALAHCDRCGKGVGLPFQQGFRCVVDQQGGLIDISLLPEHRKARCLAFASIGSEAHLDLGSRIAHREAL